MNSKVKTVVVFLGLAVLIVAAILLYHFLGDAADTQNQPVQTSSAAESQQQSAPLKPEQSIRVVDESLPAAPTFTLKDLQGNDVSLSDFLGKPVVVNFWATWCGYCVMEMPYFNRVAEELGDEVQFLMVNYTDGQRETKETVQAYIEQEGYTFTVLLDEGGKTAGDYGVRGFPTTFFIDQDGRLREQITGMVAEGKLRSSIQDLLQ
ncbi:MAG: TlpA family protein disulfide reductase [Christensenellales bacterium]|jgi:thiol-disulfide isomerase/thioredoxin